jgi:hypothetical protein
MAKTKKAPKALKHPKKPKASAPLSSWERYDAKCKEIDKKNRDRIAAHKKSINHVSMAKKKKELLIKKYSK